MYGADAYGAIPYGDTGFSLDDLFDVDAMLSESRTNLVYTVELTVWNIDDEVEEVLRLGSAEWATEPDDVPSSASFDGRLTTVLQFSRSVVDSDRLGINHTASEGRIAFANGDGAYDTYVEDYAVDGREVVVRVGRSTDLYKNHLVIFRGTAVDWELGSDQVTVVVRDRMSLLAKPVQTNLYAGSGGAEGDGALKNQRKPITLGSALGPYLAPVNGPLLIYQFHDSARISPSLETTVNYLYDRGVALTSDGAVVADYATLEATSVPSGRFRGSADGYVKLGATPEGSLSASVSVSLVAAGGATTVDIVRAVVTSAAGLQEADIDETSLDVVAADNDAQTTLHIPSADAPSVLDAAAAAMAGIGGWVGVGRSGRLRVGVLGTPSTDIAGSFGRDEGDIIDLSREKLPEGVWPPPWRWRVAFNYRYVTNDDWDTAADPLIERSYSKQYNLSEASDTSILDAHPQAQDRDPIESTYRGSSSSSTDAQAEADRLLALYNSGYRLYRMTLCRRALQMEIGDTIMVTWPRFGLDAGKPMVVVEISDSIEMADGSPVDQVEIVAFG